MVEALGTVGTTVSGSASRVVAAAAAAAGVKSVASASSQTQPISPYMKADPSTGVLISQYLSSNGQVMMQTPSAVAIAYLRSGLTADGMPQKTEADVAAAPGVLA